jgi:DNA-binding NarL/FixJ family response regulator
MNVFLIDDHPITNNGLSACLEETGRFTISGTANSISEASQFIENSHSLPSLIILDIILGEENGLDFLPFLKKFCRKKNITPPPVLVCSVLEDSFRIQTALKLGACGYISKSKSTTELLTAIDTVLRGEIYINDENAVKLSKTLGTYGQFTKKEMEVLNLIKQGKSNREIAKAMYISVRTVENHISNIYFKTGCVNRQELEKY